MSSYDGGPNDPTADIQYDYVKYLQELVDGLQDRIVVLEQSAGINRQIRESLAAENERLAEENRELRRIYTASTSGQKHREKKDDT